MHQQVKDEEIWKDIPGYEGLYKVSSFGRVLSLERIIDHPTRGNIRLKQRFMSLTKCKDGYVKVGLSKNGYTKSCKISRLVATTFILNPDNKREVNHIDGNKSNDFVSNLEWASPKENIHHLYNVLNQPSNNRKLTKEQVMEIYNTNFTKNKRGYRKLLAEKFSVTEACIKAVKSGIYYKEYLKDYSQPVISSK